MKITSRQAKYKYKNISYQGNNFLSSRLTSDKWHMVSLVNCLVRRSWIWSKFWKYLFLSNQMSLIGICGNSEWLAIALSWFASAQSQIPDPRSRLSWSDTLILWSLPHANNPLGRSLALAWNMSPELIWPWGWQRKWQDRKTEKLWRRFLAWLRVKSGADS